MELPATTAPTPEPLLDARQAQAILGCGRSFLTIHAAQFGAVKVGSRLKFTASGLAAYVARQTVAAPQPAPAPERKPIEIRAARRAGSGRLDPATLRPWKAAR